MSALDSLGKLLSALTGEPTGARFGERVLSKLNPFESQRQGLLQSRFQVGQEIPRLPPGQGFVDEQPQDDIASLMKLLASHESEDNDAATGSMLTGGDHKGTRAMGRYQIMPKTLRGLGYDTTEEDFLADRRLQDEAMRKLLESNAKVLGLDINDGISDEEKAALIATHYGGPDDGRATLAGAPSKEPIRTVAGRDFPSIEEYIRMVTSQ